MLSKIQSDNLTRWIAALISGDYTQTVRGFLSTITLDEHCNKQRCFCAIGVALEVFGFARFGDRYFFGFDADSLDKMFSEFTAPEKWFKKTFGDGFTPKAIAGMNDWGGQSFVEIACYLSNFLLDGAKKAQLQEIIMQKLDAEETYQAEIRVAEAARRTEG